MFLLKKRKYYCSTCCCKIDKFLPLSPYFLELYSKYNFPYFNDCEMTNIETYSCPKCGASDRERLYSLACAKIKRLKSKKQKILHFAPEYSFYNSLSSRKNYCITTADLDRQDVSLKLNIEDLDSINSNVFDGIFCSHILEHVSDDKKALSELYRILKKNGWVLLMTPICTKIEKSIIEEKNIIYSEADRWRLFGQNDHRRLYSRPSFIDLIKEAGFVLELYGIDYFGLKMFKMLGLKETSTLYIAVKK